MPESNNLSKDQSKVISQKVKSFADFLEKKKEVSLLNRATNSISELPLLPIGVDEYVKTLDNYSNEQYQRIYDIVDRTPVSQELVQYNIDPNMTLEQAVFEIKNSIGSVINIRNFVDETPFNSNVVSQNLEVLQNNLVSIAKDELDKALLIEETGIVDEDIASEEIEIRLRNRIMTSINDHVTYTNYNINLTSHQKTSIAVSALYAMETLHTDNLMDNIGVVVRSSLDNAVQERLNQYQNKASDGLIGKIGRFLKKVVKSVAVVAWSAVVIVGSVMVATIMDNNNTPAMITNTRAGLGLLAGVSYVASYSKKWWRWALS